MPDSLSLPRLIILTGLMFKPNLCSLLVCERAAESYFSVISSNYWQDICKYTLASPQPWSNRSGLLNLDAILRAVDRNLTSSCLFSQSLQSWSHWSPMEALPLTSTEPTLQP